MQPCISVVTLAVQDLERAVRFYRDGLGWPTDGIVGREYEHGAVAFFDLHGGLKLALWPRASLLHDAGVDAGTTKIMPGGTFTLGHNVASADEVERVVRRAEAAGAHVTRTPQATFWGGFSGYFLDLDGHLWEVVWNPHFDPPPR